MQVSLLKTLELKTTLPTEDNTKIIFVTDGNSDYVCTIFRRLWELSSKNYLISDLRHSLNIVSSRFQDASSKLKDFETQLKLAKNDHSAWLHKMKTALLSSVLLINYR